MNILSLLEIQNNCLYSKRILWQNLIARISKFLWRDNVEKLKIIGQKNEAEAYGTSAFCASIYVAISNMHCGSLLLARTFLIIEIDVMIDQKDNEDKICMKIQLFKQRYYYWGEKWIRRTDVSKGLKFLAVFIQFWWVSCEKQHNFVFKMQICKKSKTRACC